MRLVTDSPKTRMAKLCTSIALAAAVHREFVYLLVILDSFSRKVVGWELDRTLATRLPLAALECAIGERKPPPGLVHHSDRGVQYASGDYVTILRKHQMIPSMSRAGESLRQCELRELHENAQA